MSSRYLLYLATALIAALIAREEYASAQDDDAGLLRVSFIDVGQGDAIWIHGPEEEDGTRGGDLIIDGGPDTGEDNRLMKYLKNQRYGLSPGDEIDCIVASHPHADHYPGLMDVLSAYEVGTIVDTGFPKSLTTKSGAPSEFAKFRRAAQRETAGGRRSAFIELSKTPRRTLNCGNITVSVLHAHQPKVLLGSKVNTQENNASIVLKLVFGEFSFLFMGDAEGQDRHSGGKQAHFVEGLLLERAKKDPDSVRATVLKAGHHGSDTGSTTPFLQAVQPEVVVISSGRKDFGKVDSPVFLPDKTTLDRIRDANADTTILRTDENDARERRTAATDADGDDVYMYTEGSRLRVFRAERLGRSNDRRWRLVRNISGEGN